MLFGVELNSENDRIYVYKNEKLLSILKSLSFRNESNLETDPRNEHQTYYFPPTLSETASNNIAIATYSCFLRVQKLEQGGGVWRSVDYDECNKSK